MPQSGFVLWVVAAIHEPTAEVRGALNFNRQLSYYSMRKAVV